jgi:hypothetical protein
MLTLADGCMYAGYTDDELANESAGSGAQVRWTFDSRKQQVMVEVKAGGDCKQLLFEQRSDPVNEEEPANNRHDESERPASSRRHSSFAMSLGCLFG